MQIGLPFDVCARKHRGARRSREANQRVHKTSTRAQILTLLQQAPEGLTLTQLSEKLGRQKNTFSGRLTELHSISKIERTGEVRQGCDVWRALPEKKEAQA